MWTSKKTRAPFSGEVRLFRVGLPDGDRFVDAFYVQTLEGVKVTDPDEQAAIREALLEILERDPDGPS